jgi:Uma2 family endonuclease
LRIVEPGGVPLLRHGDRLSAEEFERRYDAMPALKKAELINGVVHMPPAVIFEDHGGPHFDLIGWMALFRMTTGGVRGADNSTLRLALANRLQPDASLLVLPSHGGQVRIDAEGYIVGGPDLVAEVAASSEREDMGEYLELYARNHVREYIVWRVLRRTIDWFRLRGDRFEPLPVGEDGVFRSEVLPGLWLDPAALIAGDMEAVVSVAQQGIATPDHTAFVARLRQAAHAGAQPS